MADTQTQKPPKILLADIRGRDGSSPIYAMAENKVREAVNVDWYKSSAGRKRPGAADVSLTGGTAQTGVISSLFSFVPQSNQALREFWAIDDAAAPRWKRLAGGTAWADVSVTDAVTGAATEIAAVYFNRKAFFAYGSAVDYLHCYDFETNTFRRVGLPAATAPTVADTGGGTYAATPRYYKIRWTYMVSGVVKVAGDISDATAVFTPIGTGTAARVTRPSLPGEFETHWEVFGSEDGANYFRLSQIAVATDHYDDSADPLAYTGTIPPAVNSFLRPHSAKYLVADKKRLVFAGANNSSTNVFAFPTRFGWTSPLGATDNGDDERVSNTSTIKNYDDIEEDVNGLGGPVNGFIYIFSYNGVWTSANTGLDATPYRTQKLKGAFGTIHHKTIVIAEDEQGEDCIYWLSKVGPVRHGPSGFAHCHGDVDDIWETVNLDATKPPHGVYHPDLRQIWWYVATGSSNECDTRIKFDCRLGRIVEVNGELAVHGGWATNNGLSAAARCSALMSQTLGASMSRRLKPHIGRATGTAIWKCDTGTTDAGTPYKAYVRSKPYLPWGLSNRGSMSEEATLAAAAVTGVTLSFSTIRDRGLESIPGTVSLTPRASEAGVIRRLEGSRVADAHCVEFIIGDAVAVDSTWNLDAIIVPVNLDGTS